MKPHINDIRAGAFEFLDTVGEGSPCLYGEYHEKVGCTCGIVRFKGKVKSGGWMRGSAVSHLQRLFDVTEDTALVLLDEYTADYQGEAIGHLS